MLSVLSHTDLVPAAQLKKPKGMKDDAIRPLALAVKELLHGVAPYDQRFDAFLTAFLPVYGEAARWELATAVSAVYAPNEHVCVHPAAFKQQVKVMGGRGSAPTRATSAGYTRFLSVASWYLPARTFATASNDGVAEPSRHTAWQSFAR